MGGYAPLKAHVFFEDIDWENIPKQSPPKLMPYLPSNTKGESGLRSEITVSLWVWVWVGGWVVVDVGQLHLRSDYSQLGEGSGDQDFEDRFLSCFGLGETESNVKRPVTRTPSQPDGQEREQLLKQQAKNSPW